MKFQKFLFLLGCLLLAAGLASGCSRQQPPPPAETAATAPVLTLDLSGSALPDMGFFDSYPDLEHLDLRGSGMCLEQFSLLREKYPNCEILWDIPFQGRFYPMDTTHLTVSSLTEEDVAVLDHLPLLEEVTAWDCTDYDQLLLLKQRHPGCTVCYRVSGPNGLYSYRTNQITVPGDDIEALTRLCAYLPDLHCVTLREPLADGRALRALYDAYPKIDFHWEFTYRDIAVGTETRELDLSRQRISLEEIEGLLPYLPNLTYLDMSYCGIPDADMDALNRRWESTKIVWTVFVGIVHLRTDATAFMPGKYHTEVYNDDVYKLRYCTEMECLDLGHMKITNCDFAAYMPKLKYLMLGDTRVSDLTPLSGLTELKYLELFMTNVRDYSPLLTLTGLEDLNLHHTNGDDEIISQMTWLKNLWWRPLDSDCQDKEMLLAALSSTHCELTCPSATGNGWRELPNYYAQRDIFGMPYMKD